MRTPRHISTCIDEWLDGCPFNQPEALDAIRQELDVLARHRVDDDETTEEVA